MNLTDEQIIKALECCVRSTSGNDCEKLHCPACKEFGCYYMDISDRDDSYEALVEGMGKDALDLIKRKDKVNKLSAKEIVDLKIKVEQQKAEIERLKGRVEAVEISKQKLLACFKSAGDIVIKKFAKRLTHEIVNRPSKIQSASEEYLYGSAYRQNEIIDIVKEMVGE